MTDLAHGEHIKKVFRTLLKLGYKFLKKDMVMVAEDLKYSQNPVIQNLNTLIILMGGNLHQWDDWQKKMVMGYGQALLWAVSKDTGYKDTFYWGLDKFVDAVIADPKKIKAMLKPYVKPPEEWTPNQWQRSKDKTKKMSKAGEIPQGGRSLEESVFTPSTQDKRHEKMKNLVKFKRK